MSVRIFVVLLLTPCAVPFAAKGQTPGMLSTVQADRRVQAGRIEAEVERVIATAKSPSNDLERAERDLKLTLEMVEQNGALDTDVSGQLRRRLSLAIREARATRVVAEQQLAQGMETAAAASERQALAAKLDIAESRLKQTMERFQSLLNEGRYAAAVDLAAAATQRSAPGSPISTSLVQGSSLTSALRENDSTQLAKNHGAIRSFASVETSHIPQTDEPPIKYPVAEDWQRLSERRVKYARMDLGGQKPADERILKELNKTTSIDVVDMTLRDLANYLSELHNVPIVLNTRHLADAGLGPDTPVTKSLRGVTLRSALRLLLNDLDLAYVVRDEVIQITTPEDAGAQLANKVYPVGDLVVPINTPRNLFGLGGTSGVSGGISGMSTGLQSGNSAGPGMNNPGMNMGPMANPPGFF